MSKTYRTAMIGCGKRALLHVPGLKLDERCEVVAAADINEEAAQGMSEQFDSSPAVYTDYNEMLKKEKPDVIVTCLWTPLHLPVFRDCVHAGVRAVQSEKPMAPTWGEALEIKSLAGESGCQLTFSHQRRFAAGNRAVRKMIADGLFGEIKRMDLYSPKNLLDCGTHTFDQALSFNNESPAKWAIGAVDTTEIVKWFNVSAECMATGHIEFENGVTANFQVGAPDMEMWSGVRLFGDKGFIEVLWDGNILQSAIYDDPSWKPEEPVDDREQVIIDMITDIFDCVDDEERESDIDYRKALRATEIIFAVYESVRQNKRIELPIDITDNPFLSMLESGVFGKQVKVKL